MNGSAGSILLLLLAVYLLFAYFTGRLEWLFNLGHDVTAGATAPPATTTAAPGTPPAIAPGTAAAYRARVATA